MNPDPDTRPAPICPVHKAEVPLQFKGRHGNREHWKCPKCSVFLDLPAGPTSPPQIPDPNQP